jgi:hypothetical protein
MFRRTADVARRLEKSGKRSPGLRNRANPSRRRLVIVFVFIKKGLRIQICYAILVRKWTISFLIS